MRSLGLAALSVAMSSSATVALDIDQCSSAIEVQWPHEDVSGFEDLGSSLVMFVHSFYFNGGGSSKVNMVQCNSGNTLTVLAKQMVDDQFVTDKLLQTEILIRQMTAGDKSYSFSDAVELMASNGLKARFDKSEVEICACKALYPKDRGSKTPYTYLSNTVN